MAQDINPYQSPKSSDADSSFAAFTPLRLLQPLMVMAFGAVFGCLSFVVSIALIPADVPNPTEHDLLLANYLGFLFPPLVGLWSGVVRRSRWWSVAGVITGLLIGGLYFVLCGSDFLAIMVAFPCLLGGAMSVALGSGKRSWVDGILGRLAKGLVAGFVLGFVYMVLLNTIGIFWFPLNSVEDYHRMMWHSGPIAMTTASGLYLLLFVWASNLRSIVDSGRRPSPDISKVAERELG